MNKGTTSIRYQGNTFEVGVQGKEGPFRSDSEIEVQVSCTGLLSGVWTRLYGYVKSSGEVHFDLDTVSFFTKTLALSCQKDRKNKYKYACGLMTKKTHTHPRK